MTERITFSKAYWPMTLALGMFIVINFGPLVPSQISVHGEEIEISSYDLEQNDGGFLHSGPGDVWEWGVPGEGSSANPGPGSAPQGEKVWGSPLNGTYENGTNAYLELPQVSAGGLTSLYIGYSYWCDLAYSAGNESSEEGPTFLGDRCLLQISTDDGPWTTLEVYNRTSTLTWRTAAVDLTDHLGENVKVRFLLIDNGDVYQDNGFFVDEITLYGEEVPFVDIELGDGLFFPDIVAVTRSTSIGFTIENSGNQIPPDSYVLIRVLDKTGDPVVQNNITVDGSTIGWNELEWYPPSTGRYDLRVTLFTAGTEASLLTGSARAVDPFFLDDSSFGMEYWEVFDEQGDVTWSSGTPSGDAETPSGDPVFIFGVEEGGPNGSFGFQGTVLSWMASGWMDLSLYSDAHLFLYQRYDFQGPQGSCGGIVQALNGSGDWETLEPDVSSYRPLDIENGGPLSGEEAFQRDSGWESMGFDMGALTGGMTRIRFAVSSGEEGYGEGWFIDDIMVVGEGYDPDDMEPPAPIDGLDIDIVDEGAVSVTWYSSLARDFDHYNVYLEESYFTNRTDLTVYERIDTAEQSSYIITGLDPAKDYYLIVTAVDLNGNEIVTVDPYEFRPTLQADNSPPIARINIEDGRFTRKMGDRITFDGSASFDPDDPDGGKIYYRWTMPDGEDYRGERVVWEANVEGRDLVVTLVVTDTNGDNGTTNVTIDVVGEDDGTLEEGDLTAFLILAFPVVLIAIVLVMLLAFLRSGRKKKLEKRLEDAGLTHHGEELESRERAPSSRPGKDTEEGMIPKILDLVPVTVKGEEEEVERAPPLKDLDEEEEVPAVNTKKREKERDKRIRVVLECPYCGETFREKVGLDVIKGKKPLEAKCPHCGRSGNISK